MLRVLTPGASKEDIVHFNKVAREEIDSEYRKLANDIYQVSVSANKTLYAMMNKEDLKMFEVLKELFKDEIEKEIQQERNDAAKKGEIIGAIKIYNKMKLDPTTIKEHIMEDFSLSQEEALKYISETLQSVSKAQ